MSSTRTTLKRRFIVQTSRTPARKKIKTETEEFEDWEEQQAHDPDQPQIGLLLKTAPYYERCVPLPYEMLMKIFHYVLETSEHPLKDLCNLARVCEAWRQTILKTPSLWARIDFSELPVTTGNVSVIRRIIKQTPRIRELLREFSIGGVISCKDDKTIAFIESLITAPKLSSLTIRRIALSNRCNKPGAIIRSIQQCRNLKKLTITQSKLLFNNQKWLADHLMENGHSLEELNIAMSLTVISSQLFRAVASEFCPNLRVLDLSTCNALVTKSFDATLMAQNMPNLEILRLGNVSFKPIHDPPQKYNLKKLQELSMPTARRDPDRDDPLFATLTYGSELVTTLDLRGSSMSASALIGMPSNNLKELHIDDICPTMRQMYRTIFAKWAHSLEVVSFIKISCTDTIRECLSAFSELGDIVRIRDVDLQSSEITPEDLSAFIKTTPSLKSINLSSCRSLPRGCKGLYLRAVPKGSNSDNFKQLLSKLSAHDDTTNNPSRRRRATRAR